jgi:hypothetical protein
MTNPKGEICVSGVPRFPVQTRNREQNIEPWIWAELAREGCSAHFLYPRWKRKQVKAFSHAHFQQSASCYFGENAL